MESKKANELHIIEHNTKAGYLLAVDHFWSMLFNDQMTELIFIQKTRLPKIIADYSSSACQIHKTE